MLEPPAAVSARLTQHRPFVLFWCARTFTNGAFMMQGVAMAVIVGQVLDLFDRRKIAAACQVAKALAAAALALGTAQGWLARETMFAILLLSGTARAFELPTMHAMLPGIVPMQLLPRAIAASAAAQQTAVICGPSIGGLLYVLGPTTVYLACTAIFIAA